MRLHAAAEGLTLSRRWIRPTGNCSPARADREMGFFLSLSMALPPSVPFAPFPLRPLAPLPDMVAACVLTKSEKRFAGRLCLNFAPKLPIDRGNLVPL